eukprot:1052870-Alexandrium_andersonii.AAC.1
MSASLVGSEMCIRDSCVGLGALATGDQVVAPPPPRISFLPVASHRKSTVQNCPDLDVGPGGAMAR